MSRYSGSFEFWGEAERKSDDRSVTKGGGSFDSSDYRIAENLSHSTPLGAGEAVRHAKDMVTRIRIHKERYR